MMSDRYPIPLKHRETGEIRLLFWSVVDGHPRLTDGNNSTSWDERWSEDWLLAPGQWCFVHGSPRTASDTCGRWSPHHACGFSR